MRIYLDITNYKKSVKQNVVNTFCIYDFSAKKMQKYECSKLNYKYNFATRKMDIQEVHFDTKKYETTSNLGVINSLLSKYSSVNIDENESNTQQIVVDVESIDADDLCYDLDAARITYTIHK
jgi:hypothetical protein